MKAANDTWEPTRMRILASISWERPSHAKTTKPNIGKAVLTNVLLDQPFEDGLMIMILSEI